MRKYAVEPHDNQMRIDSFLFEKLSSVPKSVIYKAFRKRSIKVNGERVREAFKVTTGDLVEVFIPEDYLAPGAGRVILGRSAPDIVYEDHYVLVVSKPQGMPVHDDRNNEGQVLDAWIRDFLRQRDPDIHYEQGFPALCHRIDRNTGGLVLMAKDAATLSLLEDKFRRHEMKKLYRCVVVGTPKPSQAELEAYLKKDSDKSRVFIYDHPVKGGERIITRYRLIQKLGELSLLEVELITGKTHQIRAHLAYIGHPLAGDGKYGLNAVNRSLGLKRQALWAYSLCFDFTSPSAHLSYLAGKTVSLPEIPWEDGLKSLGLKAFQI